MNLTSTIREVFGRFHNLNLLILLEDLRTDQTVRHGWSAHRLLCPVAHGLPAGEQVRNLNALGQASDLPRGCDYAARCLGADSNAVLRFVRAWDEQTLGRDALLDQLEQLWLERLTDAEAVQSILHPEEEQWPDQDSDPVAGDTSPAGKPLALAISTGVQFIPQSTAFSIPCP